MNIIHSLEYCYISQDNFRVIENTNLSFIEEMVKKVAESSNKDKEKNLGLHLFEGKPKVHWFVGLIWLDLNNKIVLQVTPKITDISAFHMYLKCLSDPIVSENLNKTIYLWADEPSIKVRDEKLQMEINPLIVTRYLQLLKELCKRHLRQTFQKKEENLVGRIRGRPIIQDNLRLNIPQGRLDRIFCQYSYNSLDNTYNQILKAALEQCLKWLRHFPQGKIPVLWDMATFCSTALNNVSIRRISPLDFKGNRYSGFIKPYREPHKWAHLILKHFGYDPLKEIHNQEDSVLPPFAINMNELFERYCEVYLRKLYKSIWVGYQNLSGKFQVRPDYLVYDGYTKWIIDAKYKENWPNIDNRDDIYQVLAYSRHKKVLLKLDELQYKYNAKAHDFSNVCKNLIILYPYSDPCADWEKYFLDLNENIALDYELTIKTGYVKIPLPTNNII